ncbi:hypothetical protein [Paucibacter sp. DJ1R-11]|uniref:hypothetical protein n=1 Tax=Paucibacter sp. DJ1R-11 TaxID=2893556 RepID=UPI0021E511DE|nr:hypothetical protein [Paucibacter sp. DJ1R-11]
MSTSWSAALLGLSLPLVLLAGACSSAPNKAPALSAAPLSQRLLQELEVEIGDARCNSDAQCHSLAVGAKPCGGPEGYRAWSSQGSEGAKLKTIAERQAAARRAENEASGLMSNCAVEPEPAASCQAGRCSLRPRTAGTVNKSAV